MNLLTPERTAYERTIEIIALVFLLCGLVALTVSWNNIPERIPAHFNAAGEPDSWGDRTSILILVIVGTGLYILLTGLSFIPLKPKNASKLTPQSTLARWQNMRAMLSTLKAELILLFNVIGWKIIEVARGNAEGLGTAFLPIYLLTIFGTIAAFLLRYRRL